MRSITLNSLACSPAVGTRVDNWSVPFIVIIKPKPYPYLAFFGWVKFWWLITARPSASHWVAFSVNNGNRTEWSPIRSVIIRATNANRKGTFFMPGHWSHRNFQSNRLYLWKILSNINVVVWRHNMLNQRTAHFRFPSVAQKRCVLKLPIIFSPRILKSRNLRISTSTFFPVPTFLWT